MKIIVRLSDDEAYRNIEDEEENIKAAYRMIIKEVEDTCAKWQIKYKNIEIIFSED